MRVVLGWAFAVLGFVAAVLLVANINRITDAVTAWQFTATDEVEAMAKPLALTDEGRFLLLASQPTVLDATEFDIQCDNLSHEAISGCFDPTARRIYLREVADDPWLLRGTEVVAHELAHAAWERLSDDERRALEPLILAEVESRSSNARLQQTLAFYQERGLGSDYMLDEMHSIVGTNFVDIDPTLEAHYARYFTDRHTVTMYGSLTTL